MVLGSISMRPRLNACTGATLTTAIQLEPEMALLSNRSTTINTWDHTSPPPKRTLPSGKAWHGQRATTCTKYGPHSYPTKIKLFRATVEPILLYGSETWTLSKKLEKRLDGTYTRLLMRAQNPSWKSHPTISEIYDQLPRVSCLVKYRRVQFAGHCFRADGEVISSLIPWKPDYGQSRGRKLSFPDVISRDTNIRIEDLESPMRDRNFWNGAVQSMGAPAVDK